MLPPEGDGMRDNITDWALRKYQTIYEDDTITKEDIFYYTYGILHHSGYREKYRVFLVRGLPNIPFAPHFRAFEKAGRALAELHLNYETGPRCRLGKPKNPIPDAPTKIDFGKKKNQGPGPKNITDQTILKLDGVVVYDEIPDIAYKVNGKTPIGWFVDRYGLRTYRESGNTNYPLEGKNGGEVRAIIERLAYVGVESDKIIRGLPQEFEMEIPDESKLRDIRAHLEEMSNGSGS